MSEEQRPSAADDDLANALIYVMGRAWLQQAIDDLNRRPDGYEECDNCHDWRPAEDAPCPHCGTGWMPF